MPRSERPRGYAEADLLTLPELARYLRVSEERAKTWAERHQLALPGAPGAARYLVGDVVRLLREGAPRLEAEPPPAAVRRRRGASPRASL